MNKKMILLLLSVVVLFYPVYALFELDTTISSSSDLHKVQEGILDYQVSLWISWLVLVVISVSYKWSEKSDYFFSITYGLILVGFAVLGAYTQEVVSNFNLPSRFSDSYTLGVLTAVQNIFVAGILTGFLQAGVWWFTRRWHRR